MALKAIQTCGEYREFAVKVLEEEKDKKRKDTGGRTWRTTLALGMLQVYDKIEQQRSLRAKWDAAIEEQEKSNETEEQ